MNRTVRSAQNYLTRINGTIFVCDCRSRTISPSPIGVVSPTRTGVLPVVVEIYANTLNLGLLVSTCFFLLVYTWFYQWFEYASKRSVR